MFVSRGGPRSWSRTVVRDPSRDAGHSAAGVTSDLLAARRGGGAQDNRSEPPDLTGEECWRSGRAPAGPDHRLSAAPAKTPIEI